jgi:hypothetical protein
MLNGNTIGGPAPTAGRSDGLRLDANPDKKGTEGPSEPLSGT